MIPAPPLTMRRLVRETVVRDTLMSTDEEAPAAELTQPQATSAPSPSEEHRRIWQSVDLLGEDAEALIMHRGQTYRLRCTKQGKLILYK
ncbi:hypothetical protein ETAA8_65980 [Anatilimnocola aggregata]|uniref:Hemin uptake protein HemP n=1 Tax=Anatilimnocola aggregata TaxID=2528021 RepID=A0A517YMI8_9BACT|nr:hemin uptake protein HemP [Anatilimnocola aggregata]QDU31440.1 hypothetical protein ETAA8_65980 [Anatilimnocola aggregata]